MHQIHIVHEQPESIIVQGLLSLLRHKMQWSNIVATSFHHLVQADIVDQSTIIMLLTSNDDVGQIIEKVKNLLTITQEVRIVFTYLSELQEYDIKALATFKMVAIVSAMCTAEEWTSYMEQISKDKVVLCARSKDVMLRSIMEPNNVHNYKFTNTELAIIRASRKGASLIQTAEELNLSANTIAAYRSKLLKKSGFKTMGQLLAAQL